MPNGHYGDVEAALFRKQDEHSYGAEIDLFSRDGVLEGHIALELTVLWTPEGHLTSGTLRLLPFCPEGQTQGCTRVGESAEVLLVRPVFAGQTKWDPADPGAVNRVFGTVYPFPDPAAVDFETLLAGTTWNP